MLVLLSALISLSQDLTIRTSRTDITPPEKLALGGYTERKGKFFIDGGDPLYARTLVFERGGTKLAMVSLEMLTVPDSLVREVRSRIPADVKLFMAAVHTHCAPDSQMLNDRMTFSLPGISAFSQKWLTWYADHIAGAIRDALAAPGISRGELDLKQGQAALNRPRRKDGTPDPTSSELDAGKQVLWTHYAAHATIYGSEELKTRGDWPGAVSALTNAPVFVGAIGDVSPAVDGPDPAVKVQDFRDRLEASLKVKAKAVWRSRDPLTVIEEPIALDTPHPHPTFAATYHAPPAFAQALVDKFAPREGYITAIRFGSLVMVGIPGEPTGALGLRIVAAGKKLGYKAVLVCSHVNGWIGYILAPDDYDRGGYEATLSFHGRDTGEHVVEASIRAMTRLR